LEICFLEIQGEEEITEYRRELDLAAAEVRISYEKILERGLKNGVWSVNPIRF